MLSTVAATTIVTVFIAYATLSSAGQCDQNKCFTQCKRLGYSYGGACNAQRNCLCSSYGYCKSGENDYCKTDRNWCPEASDNNACYHDSANGRNFCYCDAIQTITSDDFKDPEFKGKCDGDKCYGVCKKLGYGFGGYCKDDRCLCWSSGGCRGSNQLYDYCRNDRRYCPELSPLNQCMEVNIGFYNTPNSCFCLSLQNGTRTV